jgi:hypothetical protein
MTSLRARSPFHSRAASAIPLLIAGIAVAASPVSGGGAPADLAADFSSRLVEALGTGTVAWDRLWLPGARDSTRRWHDLRAQALFQWSDLSVRVEEARALDKDVVVTLRVSGLATWKPEAFAVARSLWTLQLDERRESNRVVRREAWRLAPHGDGWAAVDRISLSPVRVSDLDLSVGIYPEQDAMLVGATYTLRSRLENLETLRFFLDRRAQIYRLQVDGRPVELVRGNELGSFGLEGFTPEMESSLRFPRPLGEGEEVRVEFRIRSPLVHMGDEGIVTSLPLRPGSFQVRAWYPIFAPATAAGSETDRTRIDWSVRWPEGAFETSAFATGPDARDERETVNWAEERVVEMTVLSSPVAEAYRSLDFLLGRPGEGARAIREGSITWGSRMARPAGDRLPSLPLPTRSGTVLRWGELVRPTPEFPLDPHPRSRRSIVDPLLTLVTASTRDLASELADLLPLDSDALDEVFDDSDRDAEQGADDRSAR